MVKRQYKVEGKDDNQPLIMVICTSQICINAFIWRIVLIDSSLSVDDYKNPMFVISTYRLLAKKVILYYLDTVCTKPQYRQKK